MICPDCNQLRHSGQCVHRPCADCAGTGRVEQEFEVGGYGWMEVRVRIVECESCGGWGEVEE